MNKKLKKGILIFTLLAMVFFVLPANVFGIDGIGAEAVAAQETTTESEGNAIAGFLAWVTLGIASLFGKLMTQVMGIVNWLFTWQDFETKGVTMGWVIVRDLCNMFFILVLLMIAFATILRLENYSMKKYLPKLLIMAVLINFSKTICLLLIDVSQIVMLTFGNAFAGASGNFVEMLHIKDMLTISDNAKFGDMTWDMFYAAGLALIFMLIAFFVMVMMMGILIMRVIMFWILIVLAPLAFLSTAVPGGGKYWSQWWGEFTKYLIVGPLLAFFTWLSLTVASEAMNFGQLDISNQKGATAFINKISSAGTVESFILAIGLLIGTMKITMSLGAMGASFGANLASKAKGMGLGFIKGQTVDRAAKVAKWGKDKAADGAKATAKAGGRIGLATLGTADKWAGRGSDKLLGTKLGDKGIANTLGTGVYNAPNNIRTFFAARRGKKESLKQARRDYYSEQLEKPNDAIMKYDGKKYKSDKKGVFKELDKNDKITAKSLKIDGKEQKEMGAFGVAAHDSWKSAQSDARATLHRAQVEAIEKAAKKNTDANMNASQLDQLMNDKTSSGETKMAAALKLAKDGDFKDAKAVDRAREVLQANQIKLRELNTEIDKNQAHIAYDFKTEEGRKKFGNRIDKGKVDSTKLRADAYKDKNVVKALEEYHDEDVTRVLETAFKRGRKYQEGVGEGLKGARDEDNLMDDKYAKLHAKLTGDITEAFKKGLDVDHKALGNYLKNAKAKDINKIEKDDLYKMISNNNSAQAGVAYNNVASNVTYAKLKSMHKQGENPELVREMREIILAHGKNSDDIKRIKLDDDIMSV